MAIFDPTEQRMCVRIVYDGIAGTGKTTNLRMLCELFATQRKTELHSPGEVDGRTLLFDWVQILAGSICGFPLMCQVITVPGQVVLTPRRRYLLSSADVVVFVSDSAETSLARARDALEVLRDVHGSKPVVLQANKQDQADAITGKELARRLGIDGTPVTEAIASEGIGVVDTFVHAVRTISRAMQQDSERGALELEVRRAPRATELVASVERQDLDPEWAAEMVLEEALTALLVEGGTAVGDGAVASVAPPPLEGGDTLAPPFPRADVPTGFIWPAHTGREKLRVLAESGAFDVAPSLDASGRVVHRALGSVLRTSLAHRYPGHEEVRQALIRSARERTQLGPLLVPDTILVAQPAADAWWLWSIAPEVPTIAELLQRSDEPRRLQESFASAVAAAQRTSAKHGFRVAEDPASYGYDGVAVRYLGELFGERTLESSSIEPSSVPAAGVTAEAE